MAKVYEKYKHYRKTSDLFRSQLDFIIMGAGRHATQQQAELPPYFRRAHLPFVSR